MARILIIDDDRQVCETLQSLISRLGHECFAAHALKDGLVQLGRLEFDLVFLDVRLPDGNGLEALGQIRGQANPPDVIVLDPMLATGGTLVATIDLLKKAGCTKVIGLFIVAAPEGVKRVLDAHPDTDIYVAALDQKLNDQGYILPGLGDAGDKLLGTK